jgi:hypothetical protein
MVQRTGYKSWKRVYSRGRAPRWHHIGAVGAVGLADARRLAARVMLRVAEGGDPVAERRAERASGTFEELARRYVDEHARRKNRSWRQADALVRKNLPPRWARLRAADIARSDVRAAMARIGAPVVANQVLAAASAIFSWAVREDLVQANPRRGSSATQRGAASACCRTARFRSSGPRSTPPGSTPARRSR